MKHIRSPKIRSAAKATNKARVDRAALTGVFDDPTPWRERAGALAGGTNIGIPLTSVRH